MRIALGALLGLLIACSDDQVSRSRDAEPDRDARVTPPERDAEPPPRDAGPQPGDCKLAPLEEVRLTLFETSDDRRTPTRPVSLEGSVRIEGIVTAHGDGLPPFDIGPVAPRTDPEYKFLRISNGTRGWTIVTRGLPELGVREGAQVQVEIKSNSLVFGPAQDWLSVREGDDLAFLYGQHAALEKLPSVPGFRFRVGKRTCTVRNECGDVGSFALSATLPSNATVTLDPGQSETRDGFRLTHYDTRALLGMQSRCPDYMPGFTRLMVERESLPDRGTFDCNDTLSSDLAGVYVTFPIDSRCSFSLEEVRRGVDMPFHIVVDRDIPAIAGSAPDQGGCQVPDAGKLRALATVSGNRQFYGVTDVGGCFGEPLNTGTLRAGSYPDVLHWEGYNWFGPSDSGGERGPLFPAGIYTLTVTARGYYDIPDGADAGTDGTQFTVTGTRKILVHD